MQQLDYATLTDPASLAANRSGALSAEQHIRLEREAQRSGRIVAVGIAVVGVVFVLPLLLALGMFAALGAQINAVFAAPIALIGVGLLVLGVVALASSRRRSRLMGEELASGAVEQVTGTVTFTRRGYEAQLDLRPRPGTPIIGPLERPKLPRGVPLLPGRYRFYYLPRTRTLLSAEPLTPLPSAASTAAASDPLLGLPGYIPAPAPYSVDVSAAPAATQAGPLGGLQSALASGNRFTLDELALNRAGRLSSRQARHIVAPLFWLAPFGAVFVVFGAGFLRTVVTSGMPQLLIVTMGLALASIGLVTLASGLRRVADVLGHDVRTVAGKVIGKVNSSGESTTYYYKVDKLKFRVPTHAYTALVSGLAYRIYYTPRSKTLVSIEPLGGEQV